VGNVTVTVESGSHLSFDPDLDIGLELGLLTVNDFHVILQGGVSGRLELAVSAALAQGQKSFEREVFRAPDIPVPLPGTPLELTVRLRVLVGCGVQANATVTVTTGFTLSGSLAAGGHFRNGAWGADAQTPTFAAIAPTFGAGASLHASCELRPRLELLLELRYRQATAGGGQCAAHDGVLPARAPMACCTTCWRAVASCWTRRPP
jgi:hypothetical protein